MTVGEVQFRLHYDDLVSVVAGWNAALGGVAQLRGKSNFLFCRLSCGETQKFSKSFI